MKKFNESYNKILKEGLLNRTGARMSGIGGYFKNLGNAIVGKQSDNSYKQAKINSIAASSAKEMLNDFYKLGLISQPTEDQIKNIAASISGALTGSTPAATTPAATTPAATPATATSVATTPASSKSMSDEDWENNFKAKGSTPDLPETTTTTSPPATTQQPPKAESSPEELETKIKAREAELGMNRDDPRFTLESLSNFNNLYRNLIG